MEDFTEKLAREAKTTDSNETPVFKKPVIIGKRPGGKPPISSSAAKNSNGSTPAATPVDPPEAAEKEIEEAKDVQPPQVTKKSPAEVEREKSIPLPYKEPPWSGICEEHYTLEVLKNGVIVENINLSSKPFYVFGRLSTCDVTLEHPSISRYHVILQYRSFDENGVEKGWYLYDLGSTHGTFLNKQQVSSKTYSRIRAGHVFKLGASTRLLILQGPPEDEEPESELTVTQLKELRKLREAVINDMDNDEEMEDKKNAEKPEATRESDGIDWGMGEDATDENPQGDNPFAMEIEGGLNEDLYLEDPKKTLRGWFEREGYDLDYKVEERGYANFVCRIDLPIEATTGVPIVAEASVKGGKKKEAVVQCALEACRILDRHGLLRQSTHESKRQRKKRYDEDDYYSSDEDTFLDRTGAIEQKRQARMKAAGKAADSVETFESLSAKYKAVEKELEQVRKGLAEIAAASTSTSGADVDDLDSYMLRLQAEASGQKKDTSKLKARLSELSREEVRLRRLINVTKPALMPELPPPSTDSPATNAPPETPKGKAEEPDEKKIPETREVEPSTSKTTKASEVMPKPPAKAPAVKQETEKRPVKKGSSLGPLLPPELLRQLQKENEAEDKEKAEEKAPETKARPKPKEEKREVSVAGEEEEEQEKSGLVIRKRKKKQTAESSDTIKKSTPDVRVNYDNSDTSKYAMWLPPDDQSGDGKTSLNKKLGY